MAFRVRLARLWTRTWAPTVLGALAALLFALVVVKVASPWLASTEGITDAAKRAEELGRSRTAVLATLAGVLAVIGAFYTHRTFGLNRESLELNRQGQITERFTRAIDQLGNRGSLDVRLGGIYALERIGRESKDDHGPIVEILTAYVREHAPLLSNEQEERLEDDPEVEPSIPADVQAALTVLVRRNTANDPPQPWHLNLSAVYLPRADLHDAPLANADLSSTVLTNANLEGAQLQGARLTFARAYMANLSHAGLEGAHLAETNLRSANLMNTDLRHAMLATAKLRDADLHGARYTVDTVWPQDFDPVAAGALPV